MKDSRFRFLDVRRKQPDSRRRYFRWFLPLMAALVITVILVARAAVSGQAQERNAETKSRAYELYEQKRYEEALVLFRDYVRQQPDDLAATTDYASLLSQLNQHEEAAKNLEVVHARQPGNETAYFKLGFEYVNLKRYVEAQRIFAALQRSSNPEMTKAATEAAQRLKTDLAREARLKAEQAVYDLAKEFKHREVIAAVTELEKQGDLSFPMEMQRLYALVSLGQYSQALPHANQLAQKYPNATDLALLRADLLAQEGRVIEATAIWRKLQRENAGTAAATEANRRIAAVTATKPPATPEKPVEPPPAPGKTAEARIFELANQQRQREVVAAIDDLEKQGKLAWPMEMQRLYALQSLHESARALTNAERLAKENPKSVELALVRADLLIHERRWEEAAAILKQIKTENPKTPVAAEAERWLQSLPRVANLDKSYWGEAYFSGDYLGRYGTVVGSGFIRHGFYLPKARWLQPYAAFRFSADTRSGVGPRQTIIADNSLSLSVGARAQLLPTEYLFVYVEGGLNQDQLDRRDHGDWTGDFQAGIYGYKSWGPGVGLKGSPSGSMMSGDSTVNGRVGENKTSADYFWRGDWFTDAGADFSYYDRFSSWLGYGQAHEGYRLFQIGPSLAFDAYMVENIAWDARGNYFDNLFELGPGLRWWWMPRSQWAVILRGEWLNGFYFGRDDLNNRGGAAGNYDDFRVGLAVGVTW